jgi:hypothetical protein
MVDTADPLWIGMLFEDLLLKLLENRAERAKSSTSG